MTADDGEPAPAHAAEAAYPVVFSVAFPGVMSRRKGVQRAVGAALTWAVPAALGYLSAVLYLGTAVIVGSLIAAGVVALPLAVALRIGVRGPARFLAEDAPRIERAARLALAAAAYALFLTDYPPRAALERSVRLEITPAGGPGWPGAALRAPLLLPHTVALAFLAFAFTLVVPACAVWVIVFQRYPRPFFGFTVGYLRWVARALAYWLSLTDRYPPFSFAEA
jgi:hypothetical protein